MFQNNSLWLTRKHHWFGALRCIDYIVKKKSGIIGEKICQFVTNQPFLNYSSFKFCFHVWKLRASMSIWKCKKELMVDMVNWRFKFDIYKIMHSNNKSTLKLSYLNMKFDYFLRKTRQIWYLLRTQSGALFGCWVRPPGGDAYSLLCFLG